MNPRSTSRPVSARCPDNSGGEASVDKIKCAAAIIPIAIDGLPTSGVHPLLLILRPARIINASSATGQPERRRLTDMRAGADMDVAYGDPTDPL
jgi:hypothetical protein